jgi:hypothetical protein
MDKYVKRRIVFATILVVCGLPLAVLGVPELAFWFFAPAVYYGLQAFAYNAEQVKIRQREQLPPPPKN